MSRKITNMRYVLLSMFFKIKKYVIINWSIYFTPIFLYIPRKNSRNIFHSNTFHAYIYVTIPIST